MTETSRVVRTLLRGARLRCPACGEGRMFRSWTGMNDACPRCGVLFEPGRGEFTGAIMFGMGFLGVVALMGYFVLHVFLDVPDLLELLWPLFFGLAFPLLFYRNMKGIWVASIEAFDALPKSRAP